jgi:hypothetical protein
MRDALREYVIEKPTLCLDKLVVHLSDDSKELFSDELVSTSTVSRALHTMKWSKIRLDKSLLSGMRTFEIHVYITCPSSRRIILYILMYPAAKKELD